MAKAVTHCRYTPDVHEQMLHLIRRQGEHGESGEIVVGQLATDDLHINVDYPSSPEYFDEVMPEVNREPCDWKR